MNTDSDAPTPKQREERETPGYFYFAGHPAVAIPWQKIAEMLREAGHDVMVQPGFRTHSPEEPVGYAVLSEDTLWSWKRATIWSAIPAFAVGNPYHRIYPIGQPLDGEGSDD